MKTLFALMLAAPCLLAQGTLPNVAGTWAVTVTSNHNQVSYMATFVLAQNGTTVSGQADFAANPCAQSGAMSGTVSADNTFDFSFNVAGQMVAFTGTLSVNGNSASGTYAAPAGGCTQGDTGSWTATRQAPALPHITIDITPYANDPWSTFSGGGTIPTGTQTYNGVPFHIPTGQSNAWIGFNGSSPSSVTVTPWVVGATTVHTLMDTVWGQFGVPALATITFTGTGGATYTKNLIGGSDIRDFNQPSMFTTSINGGTTVNAWTGSPYDGAGEFHVLDHQTFTLPSSFASQTLTGVTINDAGSANVQRMILAALTVDGTDSPASLTISGGNQQTGAGGSTLPTKLSVIVKGSQNPIAGVTVNFAVTSGSATLIAPSAVTDSTGTAAVSVTLGQTAGAVAVRASIAGSTMPGAQFSLTSTNSTCPIGPPTITSVKSASDYGALSNFAPGSWLEIKGTNLTIDTTPRQWATADFQGANAPTSLDGSKVSINGHPGYVGYISAGQINAQAPADSTTGPVQITVTTCAGTSSAMTVEESALAPGILAPASFFVNGRQYMAATFPDFLTFVGNSGLVAGAAFRPAKPGDTIIGFGVGFGPVTPAIAPGTVVSQSSSLANLSISFGTTPASTSYAGLAANYVGLYYFYITVPQVKDGDYPINFTIGGTPVVQNMYLTVQQ